ncbi:MAG: cobalt-precorrin-5B (C(1))-methyltransferase [Chloroflexi bacterium]|nr:cobalt-precorrin-5B (C(1))-methyltransferase [Chloroflexota bacterium]
MDTEGRTARRRGKPLRAGYTTGACAAAASRAAAISLLRQKPVRRVQIALPGGGKAVFAVSFCAFDRTQAACSVIKDAGDDPDVTHGAEIKASVFWTESPGITIAGGQGVGTVTKPGLEVPVGQPAINPVPRQMIMDSVSSVARRYLAFSTAATETKSRGLRVEISVPRGEELARRTLNPRLGITGGISILGTTGIVLPYSVEAYTACISQALDVAVACGCREAVLTTGRRSERYAQGELKLSEECFIQSGDFIGFSLKECARKRLGRATVWSMIGKISKLAAGHLQTSSTKCDIDIAFLARVATSCGISAAIAATLGGAVTANHLRRMLPPGKVREFCDRLCLMAAENCQAAGGEIEVQCIMTDPEGAIIGRGRAGR